MKKVGIIGGAGPLASALLYETFVQESYAQGHPIPEIFLINYPFTRGLSLEEGKNHEGILQSELSYCVNTLVQNGVQMGILACNTLHLYLKLLPQSSVSFLSLPHLVMEEAQRNGHHRVLILGTQNTCKSHLYQHPDMEMLYPSPTYQQLIDEVIDRILEGKVMQKDSRLIDQLIKELSQQMTFDGLVLGCTDLPVLHHRFPLSSHYPVYDSIKIPAKILRGLL